MKVASKPKGKQSILKQIRITPNKHRWISGNLENDNSYQNQRKELVMKIKKEEKAYQRAIKLYLLDQRAVKVEVS